MRPTVIVLISQKGGTGKTTLTLTLAVAASQDGKTVLVLDLDPQANSTKWHQDRSDGAPLVQPTHPAALRTLLAQAEAQGADWVIIDTAAGTDQSAAAAVETADVVLVPCRPARFDLEAMPNSIRLCRVCDRIPHVVLTQTDTQGTAAQDARAQLESFGLNVLPGELVNRVAFRHSAAGAMTVTEYEPDGKAAKEARALYAEVCSIVNKTTKKQGNKSSSRQGNKVSAL